MGSAFKTPDCVVGYKTEFLEQHIIITWIEVK